MSPLNKSAELKTLIFQHGRLEFARRQKLGQGVMALTRVNDPLGRGWLVNTRKLIAGGQLAAAQAAIAYVNARALLAGGKGIDLDAAATGVDQGFGDNPLAHTLSRYQKLGRHIADRDGQDAARLFVGRRAKRVASDLVWKAGQDTMQTAINLHPDGKGYRRLASPGACGACIALATGAVLSPSEAFLRHPSCRCQVDPVFTGDPQIDRTTGEEYFNGLTEEEQQAILGPEKYEAFMRGDIDLVDLVATDGPSWLGLRQATLDEALANASRRTSMPRRPRLGDEDGPLWRTLDPDGHAVTMWPSDWEHTQEKELRGFSLNDLMQIVSAPHFRAPSANSRFREVFYREGIGPSNWAAVVVDSTEDRIVWTAYPQRKAPRGRKP